MIVSIVLFVILSTGTAAILINNVKSSRLTQQRVKASNLAQSFLAAIRPGQALPSSLPTTGPDGYVVQILAVPATATCTVGTTRQISVLVFAPNTTTSSTPLARTDSVVSC